MNVRKFATAPLGVASKALNAMRHPGGVFRIFDFLPRTRFDYDREVDAMLNSAVAACINWIVRTFPEAPVAMVGMDDDGEQEFIFQHPMLELLRSPNPFHSEAMLWMATLVDWLTTGNAYWIKIRSGAGRVVELWWVPEGLMTPKWPRDGSAFLTHYEYRPGGGAPVRLEPEDVIHFAWGMDPKNPRKGWNPLRSVLREIFTDDEAANFTATLLRNLGVPGAIISPKDKDVVLDKEDRTLVKENFRQAFGGDRRGDVMVASAMTDVKIMSWSPQQMDLAKIRQIPEERVTAVLGIPAAVVGLGTGLEQTKVGATMKELREQAYESGIIPLQRLIATQLQRQLLPDFDDRSTLTVGFDLRNVRVLQEDENDRHKRLREDMLAGGIMRSEFRKATGHVAEDVDEVFLIPINVIATSRDNTIAVPEERGLDDAPGSSSIQSEEELAGVTGNGTA